MNGAKPPFFLLFLPRRKKDRIKEKGLEK